MNLDSSLNPVFTDGSMTIVSPGDASPICLAGYDLDPISGFQPGESGSHPDIVAVSGLSSEDAEDGNSTPAAFINSVPVTVSVQNFDGHQRLVCVTTGATGDSVSYTGPLTTEAGLEFQAEVPPQPLLADDEVSTMSPRADLLAVHPQPSGLQHLEPLEPLHSCLLLETEPEPRDQDTEEPKKRKGGWPKGKKRKPQREFLAPRAPTTGYAIFVNERKVQLKSGNPELPFTEITKMLGIQWSQLSQEEKQRYNNEAEKDKQRYIRELIAYQNTEAYRDFLRRKALSKVKDLCSTQGMLCDGDVLENEVFTLSQMDGDESSDLYCRTCNQYFSSLHNKKEHLLGKQHLLTLTEEFEKESGIQRKVSQREDQDDDEEEEDEEEKELAQLCSLTSLDLNSLQELLLRQVNLREFELQELRSNLDQEKKRQELLNLELQELQKRKRSLEAELQGLRERGPILESQLQCLKMVPLLFQFHIQIIDTGNFVIQRQDLAESVNTMMKLKSAGEVRMVEKQTGSML